MKEKNISVPSVEYFYRWMTAIRHLEKKFKELYIDHKIQGALHLSIGQEAVPVGVCAALSDGDKIFSTHRSHGHYIAKTHDIEGAVAELLGRASGCSKGYGGSMHLFNYDKGFLGGNGIVGGGISLALGAAFSAFYRNNGQIGAAFFGDGAANQGILHETLNLASLLKVPFLQYVKIMVSPPRPPSKNLQPSRIVQSWQKHIKSLLSLQTEAMLKQFMPPR